MFVVFVAFIVTIIVMRNLEIGDGFFEFFSRIPGKDKLGHFVLMGILAFLSVAVLAPKLPWPPTKSAIIVLAVLFVMISVEELSQIFVESRSFSLTDLACDAAGVVVFGFAAWKWACPSPDPDREV